MQSIPCCFYPCKVMFVDDSISFLSQVPFSLEGNNAYIYERDPRKALEYINNYHPSPSFLEELRRGDFNSNILELYEEIYNPKRFDRISTLVVDYDMPELTGLELLQGVKDPHIQKILLTGAADERIAVEAFNKGYIHHYIKKSGNHTYQDLNDYIALSNARYFSSFSQTYIGTLADLHKSSLEDRVFIEFFNQFIKINKIAEYYLTSFSGNFVFLDLYGRPSALFVFDEEMLSYHDERISELLKEDTNHEFLTSDLIEAVKNHQQALCINTMDEFPDHPTPEWRNHFHPLNRLEGEKQTYYWAYVSNYNYLKRKPIVSFEEFNVDILISAKK